MGFEGGISTHLLTSEDCHQTLWFITSSKCCFSVGFNQLKKKRESFNWFIFPTTIFRTWLEFRVNFKFFWCYEIFHFYFWNIGPSREFCLYFLVWFYPVNTKRKLTLVEKHLVFYLWRNPESLQLISKRLQNSVLTFTVLRSQQICLQPDKMELITHDSISLLLKCL